MLGTRWAQEKEYLGPRLCLWLGTITEVYPELMEKGFSLLPLPDTAGTSPGLAGTEETHESHVAIFNRLNERRSLVLSALARFLLHSSFSLMSTYPAS